MKHLTTTLQMYQGHGRQEGPRNCHRFEETKEARRDPDGILEQERDVSGKTGEVCKSIVNSIVTVSIYVLIS